MNTIADLPILLYSSDTPLFVQLYEFVRDAIIDGRLDPGEALPPTRELARKLGISRHTVMKAVQLLVTQGYLDSSEQGLRVFDRILNPTPTKAPDGIETFAPTRCSADIISIFARKILSTQTEPAVSNDTGVNHYDPDAGQWRRILGHHAKFSDSLDRRMIDPLGCPQLRQAVSAYLNRFRSLRCSPSNLVTFPSSTAALDFIARLTVTAGDHVIIENPSSKETRRLLEAHGAQLSAIDVDGHGLLVNNLEVAKPAKLIYLTPAHHNPTGATLSLERRQQLLEWSSRTGTIIIEDGYDSEYWHKGRPQPPLQGLAHQDSVIHLTSFASFIPCRLGFVVFPQEMMPAVTALKNMLGADVSVIEQSVLTEFLDRGLVERYLRKAHRILSARRQQLIVSLIRALGPKIAIAKESGGTHLMVRLLLSASDEQIQSAARHATLPMISTRESYTGIPVEKQYLVPFSSMSDEQLIRAGAIFGALLTQIESGTHPEIHVPDSAISCQPEINTSAMQCLELVSHVNPTATQLR